MKRKTVSVEIYNFERNQRVIKNAEFLIRKGFTTEELLEIYQNLQTGMWDKRIGEKPEGFDDMPHYKPESWINVILNRRYCECTQIDVTNRWIEAIYGLVPELEFEKYLQKKVSPFTEKPEEISDEEAEIRAKAQIALKRAKKE